MPVRVGSDTAETLLTEMREHSFVLLLCTMYSHVLHCYMVDSDSVKCKQLKNKYQVSVQKVWHCTVFKMGERLSTKRHRDTIA